MHPLLLSLVLRMALAAPPEVPATEAPLPTRDEVVAAMKAEGMGDEEAGKTADAILERMTLERRLKYQKGDISIAGGKATLHIPDSFRYIGPADCDKILVAWGNPPGGGAEGMIIPAGVSLFGDEGWGAIVSYDEDGHVDDDDAKDMDFDDLLSDMQKGTEESNAERTRAGYDAIHLQGWAEPPHYDGANHKLYWAKILSSDDGTASLNYDIRVLGRGGVLAMSAVAPQSQLAQVKADMENVIAFGEFNQGHRYSDFDPDVDKMATYGVGALVAGGLAAKAGLFKGLFAVLIAAKKLIIVGIAAIGSMLRKVFKGKDANSGPSAR